MLGEHVRRKDDPCTVSWMIWVTEKLGSGGIVIVTSALGTVEHCPCISQFMWRSTAQVYYYCPTVREEELATVVTNNYCDQNSNLSSESTRPFNYYIILT